MNAIASTPAPSRPPLLLSRLDVERIEALLEKPAARGIDTSALQEELARADVTEPADMPADVITMHSIARVRLEEAGAQGHEHELALVYPHEADGSAEKVSILAPVGSALLGLAVGRSIDWEYPGGEIRRLRIEYVLPSTRFPG